MHPIFQSTFLLQVYPGRAKNRPFNQMGKIEFDMTETATLTMKDYCDYNFAQAYAFPVTADCVMLGIFQKQFYSTTSLTRINVKLN